jgi:F-type H+-transporting ATPase subunit alpha
LKLRPEEITQILKSRIEQYDVETDLSEVGTVLQIGDGIARVYGLENAVASEMLGSSTTWSGSRSPWRRTTSHALFGEWQHVSEGGPCAARSVASVPVEAPGRGRRPAREPADGRDRSRRARRAGSSSRRRG